MDAAFDHLQKWVKDGTLPPSAPPIEVVSAGPPAVIARDKDGNSLAGGIRLAEIAVPTGVNTGQNSGAGFCRLYGTHIDFDAATLNSFVSHARGLCSGREGRDGEELQSGLHIKARSRRNDCGGRKIARRAKVAAARRIACLQSLVAGSS